MSVAHLLYTHLFVWQCLLLSACNRNRFAHGNETDGFKLGETWVPVRLQQYGNNRDTAYLLLHHDEQAAASAAQKFLQNRTGYWVQIINKGERRISFVHNGRQHRIDPNRIFTKTGINKQVDEDATAAPVVESFAKYLLHQLQNSKVIIALHNNTDGDFGLHTYRTGSLRTDAAAVHAVPGADADDFVLTTHVQTFERCKASELNAVLQNNESAADDGSASIYFGRLGIQYINIEAQHGNTTFTFQALQKLFTGAQ